MLYNGFEVNTQCAACGYAIRFPDTRKQFRPCPECGACLSIDFDEFQVSFRWWLIISVIFSFPFRHSIIVFILISLTLYFVLLFIGLFNKYTTSEVPEKYCALNKSNPWVMRQLFFIVIPYDCADINLVESACFKRRWIPAFDGKGVTGHLKTRVRYHVKTTTMIM